MRSNAMPPKALRFTASRWQEFLHRTTRSDYLGVMPLTVFTSRSEHPCHTSSLRTMLKTGHNIEAPVPRL
ncbi:hypothetical protein SERLA73DRAFT_180869 [Serpula lacrymans var. lacrymans S7.3]|uniref:Uncharacterized protein n=2 Tax=Serpula lacrymans var. lacrymans TaxID=341189 RepID=F8PWK8_SERL3|nr:uncharacterized protein SERLADRAFT_466665 [Serpula lacrymans var. lacrymans S7.9]EGO00332.1 hypothetical protein SERLA73DRAFT_180869 [Serpula lacrymans var. lacrymans S7.3]EGO25891.1 hypothetical protein SERLADRAFT_466665 [Serpula lacrymans var. lacrymans S7.9]